MTKVNVEVKNSKNVADKVKQEIKLEATNTVPTYKKQEFIDSASKLGFTPEMVAGALFNESDKEFTQNQFNHIMSKFTKNLK